MQGTESQIDANFYQLIHQLAGPERAEGKNDRRARERQPFWADQRIAPVQGDELPDDSEFFRVPCHDLTRAGFSFFLSDRPEFRRLVVSFGEPPRTIYVRAEVVRVEHVLVHSVGTIERQVGTSKPSSSMAATGSPAMPMVLVGCRFVSRLEKPPA